MTAAAEGQQRPGLPCAILIQHNHPAVHNNLGLALQGQQCLAEAAANLLEAVRHQPANVKGLSNLEGAGGASVAVA